MSGSPERRKRPVGDGTALLRAVAVSALLLTLALGVPRARATGPEKIVGSDECGECHKEEVRAWRNSMHFKTFADLPRRPEAREIAQKLGIRALKTESKCLQCHFTTLLANDKTSAVEGVSCEACHGPARDWIEVHDDYGGKEVEKKDETPAHRTQRIRSSEAKGMLRPERLHRVADNCLRCHTVPEQRLVNVGGHPAGSKFELVSWSQGEVRHNFHASDGKGNRPASAERRRVMYVTGCALELKHSLLGVAKAPVMAASGVARATRAPPPIARLQQIQDAQPLPELAEMLEVAGSVKLKLDNEQELTVAAEKVDDAVRRFSESYDGSGLAAIDALIPTKTKGTPTS